MENKKMDVKINEAVSLMLIILLVLIYFLGIPIFKVIYDQIIPNNYELSFLNLFIGNLPIAFSGIANIIIGIWLYANVIQLNQDQWTWFLIGLVFGQFGLIFLGIILIRQNKKTEVNLLETLKPLLLLLTITLIVSPLSNILLRPYILRTIDPFNYGFIAQLMPVSNLAIWFIMFIVNIIFAVKMANFIKELNLKNKGTWIIATIFLGLFPVILFNELVIIEKNKI